MSVSGRLLALVLLAALLPACSIKKMAVDRLGDALAGTGSTFASDEDPELVGDAIPFGLKTMESLLAESPRHEGLLLAACSGFVQYAYGWVQLEADYVEEESLARATHMRARARKLYLRALGYGLRGLEVDYPGLRAALSDDPVAALAKTKTKDVPLLYWTAAAWAGALSLKINDSEVSADQPIIDALARRALALDPSWELGSIHEFFVSWEAGRSSIGGSKEEALEHYQKAVELSRGLRASPYVTYAESICVPEQDRAAFTAALEKALAVDATQPNAQRLVNILMQKRASWLLPRVDEYFIE
ncbi:MAG: TRAP transporter TatT component family protein [Acidobacteriota bacterium]|jgi:predicted anti-sigma-YlaC factor YlaD